MLEDLAFQYVMQPEGIVRLIGFAILVAGAVAAGLFHKGDFELLRAPYFVYSCLLVLVSASSQLVWLGSLQAMSGGYLWVFMMTDIGVALANGYALGVIAMARSRDAFGHGGMAALAFIPIANFWLLLKPSKSTVSAHRAPVIPIMSGGVGVLTGFILLFTGAALSKYIEVEGARMTEAAKEDPATQEAGLGMMLRSIGLEKTLREIALGVPTPDKIDEVTTIVQVVGDRTVLRYVYEVKSNMASLPNTLRTGLTEQHCSFAALRLLLDAGATIEHVYQMPDGTEIEVVRIDRAACGS